MVLGIPDSVGAILLLQRAAYSSFGACTVGFSVVVFERPRFRPRLDMKEMTGFGVPKLKPLNPKP